MIDEVDIEMALERMREIVPEAECSIVGRDINTCLEFRAAHGGEIAVMFWHAARRSDGTLYFNALYGPWFALSRYAVATAVTLRKKLIERGITHPSHAPKVDAEKPA